MALDLLLFQNHNWERGGESISTMSQHYRMWCCLRNRDVSGQKSGRRPDCPVSDVKDAGLE